MRQLDAFAVDVDDVAAPVDDPTGDVENDASFA